MRPPETRDEQRSGDPSSPALGPCCICEKVGPDVRNVMLLGQRGPTPGRGWGCVVCHLPSDGAVAVLCDPCVEAYQAKTAALRFACCGFAAEDGRIPIGELDPTPFEHDQAAHIDDDLDFYAQGWEPALEDEPAFDELDLDEDFESEEEDDDG